MHIRSVSTVNETADGALNLVGILAMISSGNPAVTTTALTVPIDSTYLDALADPTLPLPSLPLSVHCFPPLRGTPS